MEEKNEPQEQNMTDTSEQEAKYGMKKAANVGKDAARTATREAAKWIKKGLKKLYKLFGLKGIVVVLIAFILIILLAVSWHLIKKKFFDDSSFSLSKVTIGGTEEDEENTLGPGMGQAKRLVRLEGREIYLDLDLFNEEMDNWFEENNIKSESIGVSEDYSELKKFLEAEIVTLFPDLRKREEIGTPVPEGKLQGCVKFNRRYEDGTYGYLEYTPYDEYKSLLLDMGYDIDTNVFSQKEKVTRQEIEAKYNKIKDKFTLDENMNLVFAKITYTDVIAEYSDFAEEEERHASPDKAESNFSYYVGITKIDYQSKIQKYSMPFELNVAILMVTENPEFGIEITKLVKDSNIVIALLDNSTTTTTTRKYSFTYDYEKKTASTYKVKKPVWDYNYNPPRMKIEYGYSTVTAKDYEQVDANDYEIVTTTEKTTTVACKAETIDTWLFELKFKYDNEVTEPEVTISGEQGIEKLPDEEEYVDVPNYHNLDNFPDAPYPFDSEIDSVITSHTLKERKLNQVWQTEETRQSNQYVENLEERVGRFAAERFLSLVKINPETGEFDLYDKVKNKKVPYKDLRGSEEYPLDKVLSDDDFFYESLLASNDKTKDFEKIMETLILLYQGLIDYDPNLFVEYPPEDFNPFPGGGGGWHPGNSVEEKLWWALKDYTEKNGKDNDYAVAAAMGWLWVESGYSPNNLEDTSNTQSGYSDEQFTNEVDNGTIKEKEFIDSKRFGVCGDGGLKYGYGIAQWTLPDSRKQNLWNYTKGRGLSIANGDAQISLIIDEMTPGSGVEWACWTTTGAVNKWTSHYPSNENNVEEVKAILTDAIKDFAYYYEGQPRERSIPSSVVNQALNMYNKYHNAERPQGSDYCLVCPFEGAPKKRTSPFGPRVNPKTGVTKVHKGIDIGIVVGTNLYAVNDGVVTTSGYESGYGNWIEVKHQTSSGRVYYTRYGHLSQRLVEAGKTVKTGDLIGLSGNTGQSTGPHLHFEIRLDTNADSSAVDPTDYLPPGSLIL